MSAKLTQPKVEHYINILRDSTHHGTEGCSYDDKSNELLDEFFELLEQISPVAENGARVLWLRAERGPIEDFGNVEEEIEDGIYETEEEFVNSWKEWFPNEIEWYQLAAVQLKDVGYRAIMLHHNFVIVQDTRDEASGFPYKIPDFVQWLIDGVKECIEMLRAGTYDDFVKNNLPPKHRVGTICRKNFWDAYPDVRAEFFENISAEDVAEFIKLASAQGNDRKSGVGRLPTMTANDFFRFCAMGYAENQYPGCHRTPKEQYTLHADGRDDGLCSIKPDDPEAFHAWLHDRNRYGGHPWEVCAGGNSTHVALCVTEDNDGYCLILAGSAWTRTIETVKFYLALTRAGIPVYLEKAHILADRLAEKEIIGIVPDGVLPCYCQSYFPGENIIDYINLPDEEPEKLLPFCTWHEEKPIHLISEADMNT